MKILYIITRSTLGGAQSVVINLSNYMCNIHNITVVAGEGGPMWNLLDKKVEKIKINEIIRNVSIIKDLIVLIKLKKIYKLIKPDIIHLHSSKIGILGRLIFPKNKIIYTIHGFDSIRIAYRKYLIFEKLLKNRCSAIVAVSNYDKNNLIKEGIKEKLFVINNGINIPKIELNLYINGIVKIKKNVLCIARNSPPKRFDKFINIAKLLPQYTFIWIGIDNSYPDIPNNVLCLTACPNAQKYIQLADIFILPTDYEGLPIVIIEALSYGKPIVSSNVGGISEIVYDDQNGYLVDNDIIFAEKIRYILDNNEIYDKFCKKSIEIFNKYLTVDKMANKYMDLYNRIVY